MISQIPAQDVSKARIIHPDGRIYHFDSQKLAYEVYLDLPKGTRVAFRGANDSTPVYSHDYVDKI